MCLTGILPGPAARLPEHPQRNTRGETVQGLHLQLGEEVHEHSAEEPRRQLPNVQQGGFRDPAKEVGFSGAVAPNRSSLRLSYRKSFVHVQMLQDPVDQR